ncbi:hypothetical protein [Oceanobacillus damuensis]|uniref:hypothetical protein n=1 Tax=Oceanobacillus damuensis TaxID=937928 RepID=UPI00083219D9|nr:hypothetical protein [Oceanobacillus damuensis]
MGEFTRNCRVCKEPMKSSPFIMCSACLKDSEQILNYIRKHPLSSLEDISQSTNVCISKIEMMVSIGFNRKDEYEPEMN